MPRKKPNNGSSNKEMLSFIVDEVRYQRNKIDEVHKVLNEGEGKIKINRALIKNHLKDHRGKNAKVIGGAGIVTAIFIGAMKLLEKMGIL